MPTKYPCKICCNPVAKNHKVIHCDKCQLWVHIKCDKINVYTYNLLKEDETTWYCLSCSKDLFPFSSLTDNDFHTTIQGKKITFVTIAKKRISNEHTLLNRIKDPINDEDLENVSSYFDISDFDTSFPKSQFSGTNFFHMNTSSLCHNFDELHTLLARIKVKFNIIGITETRLKKHTVTNINLNLNRYAIEHTPTEANCGSALLYIDNSLNYTVKNDLAMYKKNELESIFIELINLESKNLIIGCIYRHPSMFPQ